jgi:hypothetical protein
MVEFKVANHDQDPGSKEHENEDDEGLEKKRKPNNMACDTFYGTPGSKTAKFNVVRHDGGPEQKETGARQEPEQSQYAR